MVFASVLDPGGLLAWLIVGLIAGLLASALQQFVRRLSLVH
jgi:hypothetical protein